MSPRDLRLMLVRACLTPMVAPSSMTHRFDSRVIRLPFEDAFVCKFPRGSLNLCKPATPGFCGESASSSTRHIELAQREGNDERVWLGSEGRRGEERRETAQPALFPLPPPPPPLPLPSQPTAMHHYPSSLQPPSPPPAAFGRWRSSEPSTTAAAAAIE